MTVVHWKGRLENALHLLPLINSAAWKLQESVKAVLFFYYIVRNISIGKILEIYDIILRLPSSWEWTNRKTFHYFTHHLLITIYSVLH